MPADTSSLVAGKPLRGGLLSRVHSKFSGIRIRAQQQGNGFCIAMVNRRAFVSIATTVAQATGDLSWEIVV